MSPETAILIISRKTVKENLGRCSSKRGSRCCWNLFKIVHLFIGDGKIYMVMSCFWVVSAANNDLLAIVIGHLDCHELSGFRHSLPSSIFVWDSPDISESERQFPTFMLTCWNKKIFFSWIAPKLMSKTVVKIKF